MRRQFSTFESTTTKKILTISPKFTDYIILISDCEIKLIYVPMPP